MVDFKLEVWFKHSLRIVFVTSLLLVSATGYAAETPALTLITSNENGSEYGLSVQILILMSFFSYVDLTQKKFVCVNDHWDFHPRFYKIQIAIFENWCRRSTWFRLLQFIGVLSSLALFIVMPLLLALVPACYVASKITSVRQ